MSKRFLAIFILTVAFVAGSWYYYESQKLEQPLILKQDYYLNSSNETAMIHIPYLTNKGESISLQEIRIGDRSFYPLAPYFHGMFNNQQQNSLQDFTYYSSYETQFELTNHDLDYIQNNMDQLEQVSFYFWDHSPITGQLSIQFFDEEPDRYFQFSSSGNSSGEGDIELTTYVDLTIDSIKLNHPLATYVMHYGGKEAQFPLHLKTNKTLNIFLDQAYSYSTAQTIMLEIEGTLSKENKQFKQTLPIQFFGGYVDEAMIKALIGGE